MPTGLGDILRDTADYVSWKLEEGEITAEVSREILTQLGDKSLSAVRQATAVSAPPSEAPLSQEEPTGRGNAAMDATKTPLADVGEREPELQQLAGGMAACTQCPLHVERTQVVPGQGNPHTEILFVGEAPGKDEDEQGLAFVGRAGKLLTKMIQAMGFERDDVFIANINKCRPPGNRKPTREEMDACLPFLKKQIAILQPKVIVAMGATAVDGLVPLPRDAKISKIRGQWMEFEGIPLMPTYHPAYLLRNPAMKRPVWDDLKTVLQHLGKPVPTRPTSG